MLELATTPHPPKSFAARLMSAYAVSGCRAKHIIAGLCCGLWVVDEDGLWPAGESRRGILYPISPAPIRIAPYRPPGDDDLRRREMAQPPPAVAAGRQRPIQFNPIVLLLLILIAVQRASLLFNCHPIHPSSSAPAIPPPDTSLSPRTEETVLQSRKLSRLLLLLLLHIV